MYIDIFVRFVIVVDVLNIIIISTNTILIIIIIVNNITHIIITDIRNEFGIDDVQAVLEVGHSAGFSISNNYGGIPVEHCRITIFRKL